MKYQLINKLKCELAEQIIMSWFTDEEYSKYGQYIEQLKEDVLLNFMGQPKNELFWMHTVGNKINITVASPEKSNDFIDVLEHTGSKFGDISILRHTLDGKKCDFSIHKTRTGIELLPDGDIISFFSFFGIAPKLNVSQDQIYVISTEDGTRSKVGVSKHPDKRLKELQTGSPFKLELKFTTFTGKYKAYDIEKMIHALFDDTRTNGEWFTEKADIIIKKIKSILE